MLWLSSLMWSLVLATVDKLVSTITFRLVMHFFSYIWYILFSVLYLVFYGFYLSEPHLVFRKRLKGIFLIISCKLFILSLISMGLFSFYCNDQANLTSHMPCDPSLTIIEICGVEKQSSHFGDICISRVILVGFYKRQNLWLNYV